MRRHSTLVQAKLTYSNRPRSSLWRQSGYGFHHLLADDVGLASGINAVGFDFTDRYIYGYDTTNLKIVRLGKDFQAETLNVAGLPSHTFLLAMFIITFTTYIAKAKDYFPLIYHR